MKSDNSKDTAEEGLEPHPLSPGLMFCLPVSPFLLLAYNQDLRLISRTAEMQPKHAL